MAKTLTTLTLAEKVGCSSCARSSKLVKKAEKPPKTEPGGGRQAHTTILASVRGWNFLRALHHQHFHVRSLAFQPESELILQNSLPEGGTYRLPVLALDRRESDKSREALSYPPQEQEDRLQRRALPYVKDRQADLYGDSIGKLLHGRGVGTFRILGRLNMDRLWRQPLELTLTSFVCGVAPGESGPSTEFAACVEVDRAIFKNRRRQSS